MLMTIFVLETVKFIKQRKIIVRTIFGFVFPAVICREGTIYDPCSTPCPETCGDPPGGYNCTIEGCIENCRCPDDKVLDGDHCVDKSECGCTLDNGQYLPVSFFTMLDW